MHPHLSLFHRLHKLQTVLLDLIISGEDAMALNFDAVETAVSNIETQTREIITAYKAAVDPDTEAADQAKLDGYATRLQAVVDEAKTILPAPPAQASPDQGQPAV